MQYSTTYKYSNKLDQLRSFDHENAYRAEKYVPIQFIILPMLNRTVYSKLLNCLINMKLFKLLRNCVNLLKFRILS